MMVGQRPGASPRLLVVVLVVLAAVWLARGYMGHKAPEQRPVGTQAAGAATPATVSTSAGRPSEQIK
jgi:hypothetical protein